MDFIDKECFFIWLRKLNVNDIRELDFFFEDYKYCKFIVNGFNWDLMIVGCGELIVFEDFIL